MTDIVRKINTRLERGETITEIVGAYYNYNNLVDLLCGIYDLTFEERKEVMKQRLMSPRLSKKAIETER